jgi:hypothetical protein
MATRDASNESFATRTVASRNSTRSEDAEIQYLLGAFFAPAAAKEFVRPENHDDRCSLGDYQDRKGFTKNPDSGKFSASYSWSDEHLIRDRIHYSRVDEQIVSEYNWRLKALEAGIEVVRTKAESAGVNIDIQGDKQPTTIDAGGRNESIFNKITQRVTVNPNQPRLKETLIKNIIDDRMAAVNKHGHAFGKESLPALRAVVEQDLNRELDNVAGRSKT